MNGEAYDDRRKHRSERQLKVATRSSEENIRATPWPLTNLEVKACVGLGWLLCRTPISKLEVRVAIVLDFLLRAAFGEGAAEGAS